MKCFKRLTYKLLINAVVNEPSGSFKSSNECVCPRVKIYGQGDQRYLWLAALAANSAYFLFLVLISATGEIYRGDLHSARYVLVLSDNSLETKICSKA